MGEREKYLQRISEHIDEVYTYGGMWITELGAQVDPNRVYILILPARIGAPLADHLEEQWERSGGEVLDLRDIASN